LPEIIELKHYEKITDNEGKVYNIEIRGEKGNKDKTYFKVEDLN
jgi:hypothetical protein